MNTKDKVVLLVGAIGILCWVVAFFRAAYQSLGNDSLTQLLWVVGAIFVIGAIFLNMFWPEDN